MSIEAMKLWEACQAGDVDAREQLLTKHLPLVHHVARRLARTLGADVEVDDLISAGTVGLMQAVESFDTSRGLAFSTFAAPRIRGAILDDLRRWDHAPRSVRRKQRTLARTQESLSMKLGRAPDVNEIAGELDLDVETVHAWRATAEDSLQVSIDRPVEKDGQRHAAPVDVLTGTTAEQIEGNINRSQEAAALRRRIEQLRERERTVLSLYYFQDLKLHEIAQVLGLTESRISQIRSQALKTLRERMSEEHAEVA